MNMLSRNNEENSSKKQLTEFKVTFLDSLGVGIRSGEDVAGNALFVTSLVVVFDLWNDKCML